MVLLKNDKILPLREGSHLAVVGPMGVNQDLMSDYAGGTGEGGIYIVRLYVNRAPMYRSCACIYI